MKSSCSLITFLSAFVILVTPAFASAESGSAQSPFQLPAVTVTAQKVEQDMQKVPGSVSVVTGDQLEERNIATFHEAVEQIPNLSLQKNGNENIITIRGVSSFTSSIFSSTGFYVDGVNYPIHQMQDIDLIDIERVEVLKGPQGTLYGRNSEAGVINIVTKQPGNTLEGKAYVDLGFWGDGEHKPVFKEGFSVNFPVVEDILAVRVSGQHEYTKGWMKNEYDGEQANKNNKFNGRLTTLWTPTDELKVTLQLEGTNKRDQMGYYRYESGPQETSRNKLAWDGDNRLDTDSNTQNIKIEYLGENVDITSVTSRHDFTQTLKQDADMYPINMMGNNKSDYDTTVYSEELRFSSKREDNRMFDWLVGLYAYSEKVDLKARYYSGMFDSGSEMENWGAAIFAQGTIHMAERWHLTLGGRLDHSRLKGEKSLQINNPFFPVDADLDDRLKYTEFLPSASLAFDITKDVTAYAKVSKGYMTGGFDNYFAANAKDYTYDPEYSWNYELGLKSKFLDDTLIVNMAAFQIDTKDKQVTEWRTNAMDRYVLNAAKARALGVELDVQYMPIQGLLLYASAGYLNSELKDWETKVDPFNYDGKKTPGSPEWSYAAGARYRWENGLMLGAEVQGVSHYYTDVKNQYKVNGRAVVNAQFGYEGESFDAILWAKNLFNKNYQEGRWDFMSDGNLLVQQGEPLSFGLRLTYRF